MHDRHILYLRTDASVKITDMKDNEFKCAMCGGIFEKGWTDEEAMKECKENFGEEMASAEDYEMVCNNCYQKICPQEHPHEVLMAQQEFNLGKN